MGAWAIWEPCRPEKGKQEQSDPVQRGSSAQAEEETAGRTSGRTRRRNRTGDGRRQQSPEAVSGQD